MLHTIRMIDDRMWKFIPKMVSTYPSENWRTILTSVKINYIACAAIVKIPVSMGKKTFTHRNNSALVTQSPIILLKRDVKTIVLTVF